MLYLDGERVSDARLAALALPNYGCLTTMAVDGGRVRGLEMHLERLRHDTVVLFGSVLSGSAAPFSVPEVRRLVREAVSASGEQHVAVRVTMFAPDFDLARPERQYELSTLVSVRPAPAAQAEPWRLRSVVFTRDLPEVKHVGLFGQLHQRRLARLAGYDDALFVDGRGQICEGVTWNVGFAAAAGDDAQLVWPSSTAMLPGVTARVVRSVAERAGLRSADRPLTVASAAGLPAAFVTSAVMGVRPVAAVDSHTFPDPADLVGRLAELYLGEPGELL